MPLKNPLENDLLLLILKRVNFKTIIIFIITMYRDQTYTGMKKGKNF